ncbi:MAG: hypothetical protein HUJ59_02890 [Bacilli bacterium]|nr:hypothetical protein [Bacilli bacterium]
MANENEQKLVCDETPVEETPKKKLPKGVKIPLFVVGGLVGFLVVVWGGLNILKFPIYGDYYSHKKDVCTIPGLDKEPTAQGITYDEVADCIYTTAYTKKKAATVYTVIDGKVLTHKLYSGEKEMTGHVGGIATSGTKAYLADGGRIYTFDTAKLLNGDVENVDIGEGLEVCCQSSYVFTDDTYLYVGEFHGYEYVCNHVYGDNSAVVAKYNLSDFDGTHTECQPLEVISICDKVQGFTVTPTGKYVLSTSYGIASSHFYIYDEACKKTTGKTMFGAPLFVLENPVKDMLAPPMMEDLDIYKDGTVITLTESASNKYIFGKFFFANKVLSIDIK